MRKQLPNAEKKIKLYTQFHCPTKTESMKYQTKAKIEVLPQMQAKIIIDILKIEGKRYQMGALKYNKK